MSTLSTCKAVFSTWSKKQWENSSRLLPFFYCKLKISANYEIIEQVELHRVEQKNQIELVVGDGVYIIFFTHVHLSARIEHFCRACLTLITGHRLQKAWPCTCPIQSLRDLRPPSCCLNHIITSTNSNLCPQLSLEHLMTNLGLRFEGKEHNPAGYWTSL